MFSGLSDPQLYSDRKRMMKMSVGQKR
jgi:hypothetical protein